MRTDKELEGVTLLGNQGTVYPNDYNPALLETFANKHPENEYIVRFDCPEFSKSLQLYRSSFRNHGDFHEDCVNIIMKDLRALMDPRYIEVCGKFMPRGGISINPFANWGDEEHEALARHRREQELANYYMKQVNLPWLTCFVL